MSGSWNISEEIRRVRSKATEEMLRTPSTKFDLSKSKLKSLSSAKFDWSGSPVQHKNGFDSCTANDLEVCLGDKAHASTNLNDASPRTEALDVARQAFGITIFWKFCSDNVCLGYLKQPVIFTCCFFALLRHQQQPCAAAGRTTEHP